MKVEKSEYSFKKHLIHVLVASAMAMSWSTVIHANTYVHSHLPGPTVTKSSSKKQDGSPDSDTSDTPDQTQTTATTTGNEPTSLIAAVVQKIGINLSITQTKVDTGFIRKVEGSVLKGYVPLAATTRSGVTIGDGFDLGQMHQAEFNKLPITAALKAKLLPYVGLTRFQAKDFLKAHPLTINEQELTEVNTIAANKILQPLVQVYNQASKVPFTSLPAGAQTAIFSYAYQHGPGFMRSSSGRQLWSCFITQNWQKASTLLRSSKMYASRRQQEAQLLDHLS